MDSEKIIEFWFNELDPADWWKKNDALDAMIQARFTDLHRSAVNGELYRWRDDAAGRLAEIIVIDQFSRNMFRDRPEAFAYDGIAVVLTQEAVNVGADQQLDPGRRAFMYMPLMHSESRLIHELAMKLFDQPGLEGTLGYEKKHKAIIDRFGRYPHRNEILGRESTAEERKFLTQPGSSF